MQLSYIIVKLLHQLTRQTELPVPILNKCFIIKYIKIEKNTFLI